MKKIILFVMVMVAPELFAASPSYSQFITDQFSSNNFNVSLTSPFGGLCNHFVVVAGITDPGAANNLSLFSSILQTNGVWTNVIDGGLFQPQYNPSAGKSILGNAIQHSNVTFSMHGEVLNGTSQTVLNTTNLPAQFSIAIVWRGFLSNSTTATNGTLVGAFDPVSHDGQWINNDNSIDGSIIRSQFVCQSNGVQTPNGSLTNAILPGHGTDYEYNFVSTSWYERKVWILSCEGGGQFTMWDKGTPQKVNFWNPSLRGTNSVIPINALNQIRIGNGLTNTLGGKFVGEVAAFLVLNCATTTNIARVVNTALLATEKETVYNTFAGDSLVMNQNLTGPLWNITNCPPYIVMKSQGFVDNWLWFDMAASGRTFTESLTVDASNQLAFAYPSILGKTTENNEWNDCWVNDAYANSVTGAQAYNTATNLARIAKDQNKRFFIFTGAPLWTNATSPYVYSITTEGERTNFNSLILTNREQFAGVVRRDLVVGQNQVNTNNLFSTDGLHLFGTNGWVVQQQVAYAMLDAYGKPSLKPLYPGQIGDGGSLTNLNPASMNGVLTNNYALEAFFQGGIASKGPVLLTNSLQFGDVNGVMLSNSAPQTLSFLTPGGSGGIGVVLSSVTASSFLQGNYLDSSGDVRLVNGSVRIGNAALLAFASGSDASSSLDAAMWRQSAGVVEVTNSIVIPGTATVTNGVASFAAHTPVAVTVGASAFNFTNTTPVAMECYMSGGTAYSVTKNGAAVFGSLLGDSYFVLQPNSRLAITYTVAPTLFTNAW